MVKKMKFNKDVKSKALARLEAGESVLALAKELGMSTATLYNWKAGRVRTALSKVVVAKPATSSELRLALLERDFWKSVALKGL